MSRICQVVGTVVIGLLVACEALAATEMEAALAYPSWDEPTASAMSDADCESSEGAIDLVCALGDGLHCGDGCGASCCDSCCDGCCEGCCDDIGYCCTGPKWYGTIGAVILHRERPSRGSIVATNPGLAPIVSADAYDFDAQGGPEVALGRRLNDCWAIEGRYFGVDNTASTSLTSPGNFIGTGFTGPGGTLLTGRYLTMLDSAEINVRHQYSDRLDLLAGFRWIQLQDQLHSTIGPVARAQYDYDNRLYGGQIGANLDVAPRCSRILANIEAKAGVFHNDVEGGIYEFAPGPIGYFTGGETTTSFLGEIKLTAGYQLTKRVAVRAGYQLLWLEEVALASDAAVRSLQNPSLLRTASADAGLFYHGATIGLDFGW